MLVLVQRDFGHSENLLTLKVTSIFGERNIGRRRGGSGIGQSRPTCVKNWTREISAANKNISEIHGCFFKRF